MPHWPIPHESACQKGRRHRDTTMLQARRGRQDNEARLRYPNRGYTRDSFDGIKQLPVVSFQDTTQAFIGSPSVLFGILFAQENALHKTADSFREPIRNPPARSVCQYHQQGCLPLPSASDHTGLSPAPLSSKGVKCSASTAGLADRLCFLSAPSSAPPIPNRLSVALCASGAQNRRERPHLFGQFSRLRQIKPQYGDP